MTRYRYVVFYVINLFAFTATPKNKTMQVFDRIGEAKRAINKFISLNEHNIRQKVEITLKN